MTTATSPAGSVTRPLSGSSLVNAGAAPAWACGSNAKEADARVPSGSLLNLTMDLPVRPRLPESARGKAYHGGGGAGGENGYRRPGRRSQKHPPDRRTYAFASATPSGRQGARFTTTTGTGRSIGSDRRSRGWPADLSSSMAATEGPSALRNPTRHDGGGARTGRVRRSTLTTARVSDAAARPERRRPRRVRHWPRARGSRATRGPRPPPQGHSRTATHRRPPAVPGGQSSQGIRPGRTAPAPPGSACTQHRTQRR